MSTKSKSKSKSKITKLPKPNKNIHLTNDGYSIKKSSNARHKALNRASKKHSSLTVLKRLNLIRNLSKHGSKNKKRMSQDVEYMKKKYQKEKKQTSN